MQRHDRRHAGRFLLPGLVRNRPSAQPAHDDPRLSAAAALCTRCLTSDSILTDLRVERTEGQSDQ